MKKNKFKIFHFLNLGIALLFFISGEIIIAQDGTDSTNTIEKISPSLQFAVYKNNDGTRTLNASFAYRDKDTRAFVNVKDISLTFFTGTESPVKLGSLKTGENGKAKYVIPADYKYTKSEEGLIHFAVEFDGDDKFEASVGEVDLIDLKIDMTLEEVDSVRTVKVEASKILTDDKLVPLNEETIPIFVGRMFSHLQIGEITLENGVGTFEFPSDIPGDTLGMVTIIAKFEDNETYGYVMKSETKPWGIKTSHHTVYHPRSLWTAVAPIWMIITLSIMLLGVWSHYIYVIIELVRLKKLKPEDVS